MAHVVLTAVIPSHHGIHSGIHALEGGWNSQGTYSGSWDRSGIQWLKLAVSSGALSYSSKGRIYDSTSTTNCYYFPSLAIDASNDIVVGFSGSNSNEPMGAFYLGYKYDGTTTSSPVLVQSGRAPTTISRWGDYSATTIDPNDGSFWTVQGFCSFNTDPMELVPVWGTWIAHLKIP